MSEFQSMDNSLVSILVPVYNREEYIEATVASALAQSHRHIEVVVVDNASTDSSWDKITKMALSDSRIRAYRNDQNIGPVRNWIACADLAVGQYAKILWSDDLISADFLEKTLPLFASDVGFVYSAAQIFDDFGRGDLNYARDRTGTFNARNFIESALYGWDVPYSPGCAIFRTSDLKQYLIADVPNRVDSDFSSHAIGNDLLLMLLVANRYAKLGFVNEPLSLFRHHDNSISASAQRGKLALHYNVAKGFFAQAASIDVASKKRLNAAFAIDLLRYRGNIWGMTTIGDFYNADDITKIDLSFLIVRVLKGVVRSTNRRIAGLFKRHVR